MEKPLNGERVSLKRRFETDGVRPPRDCQKDYLYHLGRRWPLCSVFGAHLPPGYGKTYISKSIQQAYGSNALVITNSNQLLDQYVGDYPDTNSVKGRAHYKHVEEYREAFTRVKDTPSIANPLSYYYGVISGRIEVPEVIIIDEAHKLYDTMFLTAYTEFSIRDLGIPELNNAQELSQWVYEIIDKCDTQWKRIHTLSNSDQTKFYQIYEQLCVLKELVQSGDNNFTFEVKYAKHKGRMQKVLQVTPVELTRDMFWPFLNASKLVLLSGTFTQYDLKFYSDNADYYTGGYLTRPENRVVKYYPVADGQRKCPETLAKRILEIYESEGKGNTLVHATYDMAKKLAPLIPDAITHTKATKLKAINRFRVEGGILIASGCAEGIDLPDDLCRVVIIPNLLYPNLGDDMVRKRRALKGGIFRYNLDTIMTTIQQLGRGTRHAEDRCKSYVLDPQFSMLYQQTYEHLPNDLNIDWTI